MITVQPTRIGLKNVNEYDAWGCLRNVYLNPTIERWHNSYNTLNCVYTNIPQSTIDSHREWLCHVVAVNEPATPQWY